MIHLTLSEAGRPLCGCPRNTTDSFFQATHTPIEELLADICPTCLEVWDSADVRFYLEPARTGYHAWVSVDGLTITTAIFEDDDHKHPYRSAQQWLRQQGAKG